MTAQTTSKELNERICNLVAQKSEQLGMSAREIAQFTLDLFDAFTGTTAAPAATAEAEPAPLFKGLRAPNDPFCAISESVHEDYIVCLENGKRMKMLKRHLNESFGMSVEEYREKWGLPDDYPMTAPSYSRQKSNFAKRSGLGQYSRTGEEANMAIAAE